MAGGVTFSMRPTTGSNCEVVSSATFESGFNDLGFDDGNFAKGMTRCKAALTLQSARGPAGEIVFGTRRSVSAREELVWVEDSHGHGGLQRIRTIVLRVVQEIALPGWTDPATGLARTFTGDVVIDAEKSEKHDDFPPGTFSCADWSGTGLGLSDILPGPADAGSLGRMLSIAHERAGTDVNRASIDVLAPDTTNDAWKSVHLALGITGGTLETYHPLGMTAKGRVPAVLRVPGAEMAFEVNASDG